MNKKILFSVIGLILLSVIGSLALRPRVEFLDVPKGGDFSIPSTRGVFKTEDQRGKTLLIFFGFTHCPFICPTTISNLKKMITLFKEEERSKISILFVSVDNERDTMDLLKARIGSFADVFAAGTDTTDNLKKIMALYGARFKIYKGEDSTDTAIDHTDQIFVINSKGVWVDSLKFDATPEELAKAARHADTLSPYFSKHRPVRIEHQLGVNNQCDLAQGPCKIVIPNGEEFETQLTPFPVTTEKDLKVIVKTTSKEFTPQEVDFEGLDLNMGFIRPRLEEDHEHSFVGDFYLPICELPEMHWRVRLIVKDKEGVNSSLIYTFKTKL